MGKAGDHGLEESRRGWWEIGNPATLKDGEGVVLLTGGAMRAAGIESLVSFGRIVDSCVLYGDVTKALVQDSA